LTRAPLLVLAIAALLLLAPSSLGQVEVGSEVGAQAGAKAGADGPSYYAGLTRGQVYLDPVVAAKFEVILEQIVILVAEREHYLAVGEELRSLGLAHRGYDELGMFALLLPRDLLRDVQGVPGLLAIYHNERMEPQLDRSTDYTAAKIVWNTYSARGRGVTIMIVDSGVDGTHPDVRLNENLIQNVLPVVQASGLIGGEPLEGQPLTDLDGHGTHVASIAAGTGRASEGGRYKGVAPEAKLVGFAAGRIDPETRKVAFDSQTVLEAFNYAIAKQKTYGIRIVSNSWGANGDFDPRSPVNIATLLMYKAGLVIVFAAGNEGVQGPHSLNKYSVAPWVLSVGAGDYLNKVASFSSRGTDPKDRGLAYDHPDVLAPGVAVTAAKSTADVGGSVTNPYTTKSGTSIAAPHVSGIAALILEGNPDLSPDEVMDIIVSTSTPVTGYEVWESGRGYVHALNSYKTAVKAVGRLDEFLGGKVKYAGAESGDPKFARDPVTVGYGAGAAERLASGSQSLSEFGADLIGTPHGWAFLAGLLLLTPLSFRRRRPE
jgi:serine protease AprX